MRRLVCLTEQDLELITGGSPVADGTRLLATAPYVLPTKLANAVGANAVKELDASHDMAAAFGAAGIPQF